MAPSLSQESAPPPKPAARPLQPFRNVVPYPSAALARAPHHGLLPPPMPPPYLNSTVSDAELLTFMASVTHRLRSIEQRQREPETAAAVAPVAAPQTQPPSYQNTATDHVGDIVDSDRKLFESVSRLDVAISDLIRQIGILSGIKGGQDVHRIGDVVNHIRHSVVWHLSEAATSIREVAVQAQRHKMYQGAGHHESEIHNGSRSTINNDAGAAHKNPEKRKRKAAEENSDSRNDKKKKSRRTVVTAVAKPPKGPLRSSSSFPEQSKYTENPRPLKSKNRVPKMNCLKLLKEWFLGNPPLEEVYIHHEVVYPNVPHNRRIVCTMNSLMNTVKKIGRSENCAKENLEDWDEEDVDMLWRVVRRKFGELGVFDTTSTGIIVDDISWSTAYGRIIKMKASKHPFFTYEEDQGENEEEEQEQEQPKEMEDDDGETQLEENQDQ